MTFIQELYPDGQLQNTYILIWCLQTKRSHWFRSSTDAQRFVATAPNNRDHYVGVGLSPKDFGSKSRCSVKDIAALAGSYVDIDIYHETAHKKTNLPRTMDEAMKIIEGLPTPSYIIHTGHGLQVWWLFDGLWHLTDQDELETAKWFAKSWTDMTRSNAAQYGYDVDSTGDLARVLRIPGTTNNKVPTDPVKVTVYQQNEVRYSKEDLIEQCREHMASSNGSKKKHTHFDLDPNAHPPFDNFMALMENNARFKKTFNQARKDLQDQSARVTIILWPCSQLPTAGQMMRSPHC